MILIVDPDLGFLFWLGQVLAEAGYAVLPAVSCGQALDHSKKFRAMIDDVIVEPGLSGVSEMLRELGRLNSFLKIIFIGSPGIPGTMLADMMIQRPRSEDSLSPEEWLTRLQTVLSSSRRNRASSKATHEIRPKV